jgi:hypothetical protein
LSFNLFNGFSLAIEQNAEHNDDYKFVSLDGISPKVIANELTLIAKELFLSIKNTEIITLLIRPHSINPVCS